jgi:cytosine/adenosine deaminase-related metal-dependent hydrolase
MVPHAPYSVSKDLFKMLDEVNSEGSTVSIHNQEVAAEDQLFRYSNGRFIDFYEFMNLKTESIPLTGMSSLHYALSNMNPAMNTLLVHNTMCEAEDIEAALNWSPNIYWVTCPNANLYIENKLPDYRMMLSKEVKMCIGTDSLSSNWQLSIFEEMKTIKKYQSTINDLDLIRWATVNGAEALGYNDLGRIEKGLTLGLILSKLK